MTFIVIIFIKTLYDFLENKVESKKRTRKSYVFVNGWMVAEGYYRTMSTKYYGRKNAC